MTAIEAVLLPVDDELYALPVSDVREVAAAPRPTRLVTAPSAVLGLFNLRGEIIPLWDVAALLNVGAIAAPRFAIVLSDPPGRAAVATVAAPHRAVLGSPVDTSELPGTAGAYRVGDRVAVLIDPSALFSGWRAGPGARTDPIAAEAG
ncbi:MAG TPA: chemotaxis protein CheW [Amycolatopsis sp.]|nr:chemotaxis protein CheW [Amycolatopsis sp.]